MILFGQLISLVCISQSPLIISYAPLYDAFSLPEAEMLALLSLMPRNYLSVRSASAWRNDKLIEERNEETCQVSNLFDVVHLPSRVGESQHGVQETSRVKEEKHRVDRGS